MHVSERAVAVGMQVPWGLMVTEMQSPRLGVSVRMHILRRGSGGMHIPCLRSPYSKSMVASGMHIPCSVWSAYSKSMMASGVHIPW